jgi:solute carrier family 36 (proton-coupled amino acid transporter)
VTEDKEGYFKLLVKVLIFIAVMFIAFGELCIFSFGEAAVNASPLITSALPQTSVFIWIIEILFCFNLIFSYPLVIYPANMVVESYLFHDWPKTRKRQMCKNLTRSLMVLVTIVMALAIWDYLDKFLSIAGALFCTPIAFILPAMFHLKGAAVSGSEKIYDICIIIGGCIILVFCTIFGIVAWDE